MLHIYVCVRVKITPKKKITPESKVHNGELNLNNMCIIWCNLPIQEAAHETFKYLPLCGEN